MKRKYEAMSKKEARKIRHEQQRAAKALRKANLRMAEVKRQMLKKQGDLEIPQGSGTGRKTSEKRREKKRGSVNKLMQSLIVSYERGNVPEKHAVLEHPGPCPYDVNPITRNDPAYVTPRRRERHNPSCNAHMEPALHHKNRPNKPYDVLGQVLEPAGRNGGTTIRNKKSSPVEPMDPRGEREEQCRDLSSVEHMPSEPKDKVHTHGGNCGKNREDLLRNTHTGSYSNDHAVPASRNGPGHSFEPYHHTMSVRGKTKLVESFSNTEQVRREKRVQAHAKKAMRQSLSRGTVMMSVAVLRNGKEIYCRDKYLMENATDASVRIKKATKPTHQASIVKQDTECPLALESRRLARATANYRKTFRDTRDQRVEAARLRNAAA